MERLPTFAHTWRSRRTMIRGMPRWLALALCAVGVAALVLAVRQSTRGRELRRWTRTTGRVLVSRVEELDEADEQRRPRRAFVIRYTYDARGVRLESDQVWIGSRSLAASEGEDVRAGGSPASPRAAW